MVVRAGLSKMLGGGIAGESSTELAHADAVIDQQSGYSRKQVDSSQPNPSIRKIWINNYKSGQTYGIRDLKMSTWHYEGTPVRHPNELRIPQSVIHDGRVQGG